MRYKLFGLAAATFAATSALAGQPITITSAGIYNPGNVSATVNGQTMTEFAVPLTFTGSSLAHATFDALGFCVDLPHLIYVGLGSQLQETLHYTVSPLTNDGYGNTLTGQQVHEISGLAALGFGIAGGNASDKPAQLAAIQQAIWTIEYPTATFVATGPYAAAQATYAAQFVAQAPTLRGYARNIVSIDGVQGQITNIADVPEPATWAMLVAGFGIVGLATRRRGAMTTVAA